MKIIKIVKSEEDKKFCMLDIKNTCYSKAFNGCDECAYYADIDITKIIANLCLYGKDYSNCKTCPCCRDIELLTP